MEKVKTNTVSFQISGEFVTEHFRTRVMEGDYRSAMQGLRDSLFGITTNDVEMVLKGEAQLVGTNSVEMVEDNKHLDKEWIQKQYYPYFNKVVVYNGQTYRQYKTVAVLTSDDMYKALNALGLDAIPIDTTGKRILLEERVKTFMKDRRCDIAFVNNDDDWVLIEPVTVDYPIWLTKAEFFGMCVELSKKTKVINGHLEEVPEIGSTGRWSQNTPSIEEFVEQSNTAEEALNNIDALKAKIKQQADERGGWLNLSNRLKRFDFHVPRNAFLKWCLSDSPLYNSIDWPSVSPRGMKMGMDDPNHTDWFLFTDIPLSKAKDTKLPANEFFYRERHRIHEELTGSNIKCLTNSGHKGLHNSPVVFIRQTDDEITKDSVVIIPNGSPKYERIAHKCAKLNCVLITETGGPLCHLATVGREMGVQLYLMPDASKHIPEDAKVSVNTGKHILKIEDHSDLEYEALMLRKASGEHYE